VSETVATGSCHCGRVRFWAKGAPRFVTRCHCASCRRTTGGAFSVWVGFKDEMVYWSGEPRAIYASSPGVARGFCRSSGTPLTYGSQKWPGETHFLIGAFSDPGAYTPTGDYQKEEALAWAIH
jgi:hypothetical protein